LIRINFEKIERDFSWDNIIHQYEKLLTKWKPLPYSGYSFLFPLALGYRFHRHSAFKT
jgi:hypothetical protein